MQHLFRSKPDGGRVFRSGLYSAAILAAATALTVLVNLVVQALPVQYTTFDLSTGGLYTLGDTSRAVAAGLDRDVVIYYLCETGQEDAIITGTLDQYAAAGSRLRWELKDPALYPTFAAQYGAETAAAGSLIIDAGTGSAVLDAAGLYVYDYSDYYRTGGYTVRFDGEEQITSALYRLTSGPAARAYYTTNHGERALSAALTAALEEKKALRRASIRRLSAVGVEQLILLTGDRASRQDSQKLLIVENLRRLRDAAEKHRVRLLIEPLNSIMDCRGYYLDSMQAALEIAAVVDSPYVQTLYDVYHMQIMEGNVLATLGRHLSRIGHIHLAGVPGRHEPCGGELNMPRILSCLAGWQYDRYVGLEYWPVTDTYEQVKLEFDRLKAASEHPVVLELEGGS